MHDPDFQRLSVQLQAAGIGRRHAERSVAELKDHYADLVEDLQSRGLDAVAARAEASRQLGDLSVLGQLFAKAPKLRTWPYRYPALARCLLPVACLAVLPVTPVIAGWQHASVVMRWAFAMLASAAFTAILLGFLQLSIQLS